jgi:hypothetical protein
MLSVGRGGDLLDNTRRASAEQHLRRPEHKLYVNRAFACVAGREQHLNCVGLRATSILAARL